MARKVTKKAAVEAQAAVDTVATMNVNSVVSELGSLQVEVQKTLADLGAKITGKLGDMDQIDKAIAAKKQQLQELYGIEQEAMSLEEIKAQRETEVVAFAKEQDENAQASLEASQERQKKWDREEEEHNYDTAVRAKRCQEEYMAIVAQHQREEKIRQETLERQWAERTAAIKAQETEITDLRAKVNGMDALVAAEVKKAEAIVGNTVKRQYEQEMALVKKDMEASDKLHTAEVTSLKNTISGLSDQIEDLQKQLAAARQDAKEVTAQALQAGSQKQAFDALQQVVNTQSTATGKSGK